MSNVTKAYHIDPSAAISARIFQSFACKTVYRDCVRTGTKNTIMVIIGPSRRQDAEDEEMNANEKPNGVYQVTKKMIGSSEHMKI